MNNKTILIVLLFVIVSARSQTSDNFLRIKDSLLNRPNDSVKVDALIKFCMEYDDLEFVGVMELSKTVFKLTNELKLHKRKARFYNQIGDLLSRKGSYQESFRYYYAGYKLADSINSRFYKAISAYNLGWQAAIQQKNYSDVSYLYESLSIGEDIKSNGVILRAQNALASFYTDKYDREHKQIDFDSAVKYFSNAIEKCKAMKAFEAMGPLYSNMGQLFYFSKDYNSSIFYYEKSISTFSDSSNIAWSMLKIGAAKFALKKPKEALKIYDFVYNFLKTRDIPELRKDCLQCLLDYYKGTGDQKRLFEVQREFVEVNDKLNRDLHAFTISNMDTEFEFARSEASNVQLERAGQIEELKNKRKNVFIYILALIGSIVVVIGFLLFKQNKLKRKTNLLLMTQHKTIVEKNLEIEQSIEYAKGIQTAFLPSKEELSLVLKESFILYKPKDVVSGDFYWYLISEDKKGVLLACADCTGHGVPGALMSMVGINILQQLCVERRIQSPGQILKYLNAEIKSSLKQNNDESKQRDGMDIALIHIDITMRKLTFAGANRPLYIVRNKEVLEYRATKHAIGGFTKYDQTFEETKIELEGGDFVCLSTDGYADQFGGPNGKKLMTKKLKEFLAEVSVLTAEEQKEKLEQAFNKWKGSHAQIDDVCLIGLKV